MKNLVRMMQFLAAVMVVASLNGILIKVKVGTSRKAKTTNVSPCSSGWDLVDDVCVECATAKDEAGNCLCNDYNVIAEDGVCVRQEPEVKSGAQEAEVATQSLTAQEPVAAGSGGDFEMIEAPTNSAVTPDDDYEKVEAPIRSATPSDNEYKKVEAPRTSATTLDDEYEFVEVPKDCHMMWEQAGKQCVFDKTQYDTKMKATKGKALSAVRDVLLSKSYWSGDAQQFAPLSAADGSQQKFDDAFGTIWKENTAKVIGRFEIERLSVQESDCTQACEHGLGKVVPVSKE